MDQIASTRVYKKTSANSILTLYLGSRDLVSKHGIVEPLRGVIYLDPKFMGNQKIYGQLTLTFRYGREDEEVMGLKFCNEAVIAIKQIWPRVNYNEDDEITPLQQALVERLGIGAYPFSLKIGMLAPPSVQLEPSKKYHGAPIGTSYDIRIFMSDVSDEKFLRRTTVKLGIRLIHKIPSDTRIIQQTNPIYTSLPKTIRLRLSPKQLKFYHHKNHQNCNKNTTTITDTKKIDENDENMTVTTTIDTKINNTNDEIQKPKLSDGGTIRLPTAPTVTANVATHPLTLGCSSSIITETANTIVMGLNTLDDIESNSSNIAKGPERFIDKPFLWTEGRVSLKASLNKSAYKHDESILVTVNIKNNSRKIIRKIRVFAVQHVDVCMFSNGKFKNVVADINENHQIKPTESHQFTYNLVPLKGQIKNWVAVEGTFAQGSSIGDLQNHSQYKIASSAHRGPTTAEDRNVFAIYVSYYIKVKLILSGMGGEVSLKLPFILGYVDDGSSDDDDDDDDDDDEDTNNDDKKNKQITNKINTKENNKIDTERRGDDIEKNKYFNNKNNDDDDDDDNTKNSQVLQLNETTDKNYIINDNNDTTNIKLIRKCSAKADKISANNIIEEELQSEDQDDYSLSLDEQSIENYDNDIEINKNNKNENIIEEIQSINYQLNIRRKTYQEQNTKDEKLIEDKIFLNKLKLKRSSYSRSCEDIETFSKSNEKFKNNNNTNWCVDDEDDENSGDEGYLSCSRALCHRHSIETNG